ncbi:hypothetical protein GCM10025868_38880 [Angustibacter aerolatus]|uniref:Deoxyribodipyrimidine photo-lyase n=1 Tax=Angustibacter aerolatus TaxID=1162965 RepID=A0ABQ6JMP0_9ACTN|nr:hypothetical protein GCM10025868_38880 [Angustibacter aerolatus]
MCHPTSYGALRLVNDLPDVEVLPARGFATAMPDFRRWADGLGGKRMLLEDFYRRARVAHGVLVEGTDPVGGKWNLDHDNREPPPKGVTRLDVTDPWWPEEDEIDAQVREDLDRWERDGDVQFVGDDGPRRFAATRAEAVQALERFVTERLPVFGPHEDAMLQGDDWMAHSLLSAPMNLGLLDPLEVVQRAEEGHRSGDVPLASAEGFVRQVIGWRDYVWHLYWYTGEEYRHRNALQHKGKRRSGSPRLDDAEIGAACLSDVVGDVREHGWTHHIPRLMVLGNYAMQRGWDPLAVTDWFHRAFVDGYDWVMVPNVVGMSQHADGGLMATKPYAAGGAYINKMSDYCRGCRYDPRKRLGEDACPFTAGYWTFIDRHRDRFAKNHRMTQAVRGLDRLSDVAAVVEQEQARGSRAPDWPRQQVAQALVVVEHGGLRSPGHEHRGNGVRPDGGGRHDVVGQAVAAPGRHARGR